ncbi:DNA-binding GntR family transcriptional regulator [Streptosporangium becharense]|uniref:DNA-binding GntR family transcriptional regulator n=1 Tax=Streptosporangium becharense TaxID=1816182 RepID=A0A7W9MGY6_9ACTN|nr:GntR family transcriptional regulator [Streptosporangium becharense]MBB2914814.1 DNA-binding GntR family transcriptional regulator [Streptosporangium becharense]MBB5820375.1 DNA-binding GntR family transcriptional regulator [Streptosporangium becharense]
MSMDFAPPKYAQVMTAIQQRIQAGEYAPGDMLPSETQLVREFGVGRTTVVRALQTLAMQGWIEREHGRGSFVKGRPESSPDRVRPGLGVAEQAESAEQAIEVHRLAAPRHIARLLGVAERTPVLARQRVARQGDRVAAVETLWFPLEVALGTDLDRPDPLRYGVRQHLQAVKHLRFDHVTERLTARAPSEEETDLLGSAKPVLGVVSTVHDAAGTVLLVVEAALPGDLHELQDVYPVS